MTARKPTDEQGMAVGNILIGPAESDNSAVLVRVHGQVDSAVDTELRSVLIDMILHRRTARIQIDLHEATLTDACAIGTLQGAVDLARDCGLTLSIHGAAAQSPDDLRAQPEPRLSDPPTATHFRDAATNAPPVRRRSQAA